MKKLFAFTVSLFCLVTNVAAQTTKFFKVSLRGAWVDINGVDANKVYAIACCIAYWLDSMGYGLDFKNELKSLLVSYPQVDPAALGFPKNWISDPLWR